MTRAEGVAALRARPGERIVVPEGLRGTMIRSRNLSDAAAALEAA